MKKILACLVALVVGLPLLGRTEPLSFEQAANVTGSNGGFELGAGVDYGFQKVLQADQSTLSRYVSQVPIFARLGFTGFEIKASLPYSSISSTLENGQNGVQGFRDVGLGVKFNTMLLPILVLGVGANTVLPTISTDKYLYNEGLGVNPFAALDILTSNWLFHVYFGYNYVAQYQRSVSGQNAVTFKPGNQWLYGLGTEIGILNELWLLAEVSGTYYGEARSAGDLLPGSQGNVISVYPGLRLQLTPLKVKAGVEIPLRQSQERPAFVPSYDWRILGTVSLLVPFGATSAKPEKGGY